MSNANEWTNEGRARPGVNGETPVARRAEPAEREQNMGETEGWISSGLGGLMVARALSRRGRGALPLAAVGSFLVYRGATRYCPAYAAAGIDRHERRTGPDAVSTVTINKPAEEIYRFWRDLSNLPKFISAIESVEVLDETRSRWRTCRLGGQSFRYEAEIVEDTPNNGIRWKSVEGSPIEMRGSVRFKQAPADRGTVVVGSLIFGRATGTGIVGRIASPFAKYAIHQDLTRLKRLLETGEIPSTEQQPVGPQDSESRSARQLPASQELSSARGTAQGAGAS